MNSNHKEYIFDSEVLTRFELYNSLFTTLPFDKVRGTGILMPFFKAYCEEGIENHKSPIEIIEDFFSSHQKYDNDKLQFDLLFQFIQFIERQVVLFDAVEDSSFKKIGFAEDTSLQGLLIQSASNPKTKEKIKDILDNLTLRLVLTAHPTQFYPGPVLSIITDLNEAIKVNDLNSINLLLQQLGKTPFFNKKKPTPFDEAISLAWFLENVFYPSAASIQSFIENEFDLPEEKRKPVVELGFWPGGDRDGNPNVTVESTKAVSELLRTILFRSYYRDFRILKRRVTFRGIEAYMDKLQDLFYINSFNATEDVKDQKDEIIENLEAVKAIIIEKHNGLFADVIDGLISKVKLFGCYFSSLDIRQDSSILRKAHKYAMSQLPGKMAFSSVYETLSEEEKLNEICFEEANIEIEDNSEPLIKDCLKTIRLVKNIQYAGGEKACHRFIISNCQEASDILQLINLFLWNGWKKSLLKMDFVPLFETVDDLKKAGEVMDTLYKNSFYRKHLKLRKNRQTIMLGFSDSTKDGGYLMANWSIFKAKAELTRVSKNYDIDLTFFDGRGGPPARGGGKTHRFYASMGQDVANEHIQVTIQGQTISSQYGSFESASFNMEQLINAGIVSALKEPKKDTFTEEEKALIDGMAKTSYDAFLKLRKNKLFLPYLEKFSPLRLLSDINISSRPVKRNGNSKLKLEDLRAISFVTSWSQLKQNIPGFYGVGTALMEAKENNLWEDIKALYQNSLQFKTMIDNCMMSMSKSDFRVTSYLEEDKEYSDFWKGLRDEYDLTKKLLLELSGESGLMQEYPVERKSIAMREKIVLPLVIIQHYALQKLNADVDGKYSEIYKKLVIRTVYGIVNAGRNLA